MSKELFTPGEWEILSSDFGRHRIGVRADKEKHIAEKGGSHTNIAHTYRDSPLNYADANLIAASKDMYYALKPFELLAREVLDVKTEPQIIYAFNGAKITTGDLIAVLKAIQKAKGQQ